VKRFATIRVCALLICVAHIATYAAESVRVTSGALSFGWSEGELDIEGVAGFSLHAPLSASSGNYGPFNQCAFDFCPPGTDVSLHAFWSTPDLSGSVTLRGQNYALGQEGEGGMVGHVEFAGHVVLPEYTSNGTAQISAPFSFEATLTPELPDGSGQPETVSGQGVATLSLTASADRTTWRIDSTVYRFQKK